ncbi:hypothetical protein [Actinomadura alba]|uniref:Uncharacterized protein n=1 Tax=Actinomadura alba TaxID=406431 RepID=A0ABR7LY28_9ACTN|nr:hypothetical protein [Actinomadura alba]MBC6469762.1 hypothetical protein [Actinomadura alba]
METPDSSEAPDRATDERTTREGPVAPADGSFHERTVTAYAPLTALYRLFDGRLREGVPQDPEPIGWRPHLEALAALSEGRVSGDLEALARLLVDPAALPEEDRPGPALDLGGAVQDPEPADATPAGNDPAETMALPVLPDPVDTASAAPVEVTPDEATPAETMALPILPDPGQTPPAAPEPPETALAHIDPVGTADLSETALPAPVSSPAPVETPATPPARPALPAGGLEIAQVAEQAAEAGRVHLIRSLGTGADAAVIAEFVRRRSAGGARTLLLVPTADAMDGFLAGIGVDEGVFAVRIEPRVSPAGEPSWPEDRIHGGVVRAVGTSYQRAWEAERQRLRRDLMWLEQWPRDLAALAAVRAEHERRSGLVSENEEELTARIRERNAVVAAAEQEVLAAREAGESLVEHESRAAAEATRTRTEWERLQGVADAAAHVAEERTRGAESAAERHRELSERHARCVEEFDAARQRERSLIEELARAEDALPEADADVERFTAAATQAAAVGHACYYRMAAAESALAAERRKLSLAQRMRIVPSEPGMARLRRELSRHKKEAEEAAAHARQTSEALDKAERHRDGLATFLAGGADQLAAVRQEQARLSADIARVSAERDGAEAEHREHAERVGEAVERATETGAAAAGARAVGEQAEERLAEARRAREEAAAATDRAVAEAETAKRRLGESEAELRRRREEGAVELADGLAEIEAAAEAAAGSRGHVAEICGTDPVSAGEDVLADHRNQTMARIERISTWAELLGDPAAGVGSADPFGTGSAPLATGALDGDPVDGGPVDLTGAVGAIEAGSAEAAGEPTEDQPSAAVAPVPAGPDPLDALGEIMLATADVVCGTALGIAACPTVAGTRFDTLLVADAGRISDGEFLIGAVRARGWVLIGDERRPPAGVPEPLEVHVRALTLLGIADESPDGDLDAAAEAMPAPGGEADRASPQPAVRTEAERLRAEGLWESRYRDAYDRALRPLRDRGEPGRTADPRRDLVTAMADRLGRGPFGRAVMTAPEPPEPPSGA